MGDLKLNGSTSGTITVTPTAVAGTNTITLPASTGTVALTASPTFSGTLTATTITSPASTALTIQSAGTTAMTISTGQNVGIGTATTSPARLNVFGTGTSTSFRGNINAIFGSNGSGYDSTIRFTDSVANSADISMKGGVLATSVNGIFATYIDSSGNLLVGKTSTSSDVTTVGAFIALAGKAVLTTTGSDQPLVLAKNASTSGGLIDFFYNGSTVAQVTTNGTGVTYGTSSDYRLKNSVAPMTTGLATVSALKPVTYKWNADDSDGEGFIAHELQAVIPHAVTGEKDAVNEDGSIKPQNVDYSKIVVHLVAACQELSAKNDALEARLAALEAK